VRLLKQTGQMDVQECRDMALVEETDMTQVDWLLKKHRRWNHLTIDEVPCSPHVAPFLDGGKPERRAGHSFGSKERERNLRTLEQPEGVARRAVCPAVHGAKVGFGEEPVCVFFGVLYSM
jgi:hypothetical protein